MSSVIRKTVRDFYHELTNNFFFNSFFEDANMPFILDKVYNFLEKQLCINSEDIDTLQCIRLGELHVRLKVPLNNVLNFLEYFGQKISTICEEGTTDCKSVNLENITVIKKHISKGYLYETVREYNIYDAPMFNIFSTTRVVTSIIEWILSVNETVLDDKEKDYTERCKGAKECSLSYILKKPMFRLIIGTDEDLGTLNNMHEELHNIAFSIFFFLKTQDFYQSYVMYREFLEHCRGFLNFCSERKMFFKQNDDDHFFYSVKKNILNDVKTNLICINLRNLKNINKIWGNSNGDYLLEKIQLIVDKNFGMHTDDSYYIRNQNGEFIIAIYTSDDDAKKKYFETINAINSLHISREFFEPDIKIASTIISIAKGNSKHIEFIPDLLKYSIDRAKSDIDSHFICGADYLGIVFEEVKKSMEMEHFVQSSFKEDKFVPFYQPIYTANGKLSHVEVLSRIQKDGITVSAGMFIDYIIEAQRVVEMDGLILDKVEKDLPVLKDLIHLVFLNISPRSLGTPHFIEKLVRFIQITKEVGVDVVFEITEQTLFDSIDTLAVLVEENNATFAIDDFGSGYSNLRIVAELASRGLVKYLKIDGSLIKDICESAEMSVIVQGVCSIARSLFIETIAEYVSDQDIYDKVRRLGVDYVQGFHLAVPVSLENLKDFR